MAINAQSYLKAVHPLSRSIAQGKPRNFVLHWDNHKVATRRRDKDDWHEAWATLYPSGTVTMENGMFYRNMGEMRAAYEAMGEYRIEGLDEQEKPV